MIKIENYEVVGWKHAIRGMRNPMNSWDKSDSHYLNEFEDSFCVGENDLELMRKLAKAGTDHRKFMRMITVYCDAVAPRYWWAEADAYKVGTVRNSCSTMHKIHSKEFTLDDFSCEHLSRDYEDCNDVYYEEYPNTPCDVIEFVIDALNQYRDLYNETKDKKYWWQMIQLLPSSYNQRATLMLNYEVLANIYKSRRNHKLDEWRDFCLWVKTLPYSKLITGEYDDKDN